MAIAISYFYNSTHYFHTFLSLTFELHVTVLLLIHMEQVLHPILFQSQLQTLLINCSIVNVRSVNSLIATALEENILFMRSFTRSFGNKIDHIVHLNQFLMESIHAVE